MILASSGKIDKNTKYTSIIVGSECSCDADVHEWFHILHDNEIPASNKWNHLFHPISDINEPSRNFEIIKNMCRNPNSHLNSGRRPILLCYQHHKS